MAQEQGFEPWHRVTDLRAFQARPFNRLGIPALAIKCLTILPHFQQMPRDFVEIPQQSVSGSIAIRIR